MFFNEFYESEEKLNKPGLIVGSIFITIGILCLTAIINVNVDITTDIFRWYFMLLFFIIGNFSFSASWFQKPQKKPYILIKWLKYSWFIISLVSLALIFAPVTLFLWVLKITKTEYFWRHSSLYIICIIIPLLFSMFIGAIIFFSILDIEWINSGTVSVLISFVLWKILSLTILYLWYKFGKSSLSEDAYISIKKDLNILVFLIITSVTLIANCINFSPPYNEVVRGFTLAFTVYIAFDRLIDKWKKHNTKAKEEIEKKKNEKLSKSDELVEHHN